MGEVSTKRERYFDKKTLYYKILLGKDILTYIYMEQFTLQELGYFLVMILGSCTAGVHVIQRSRCTTVQCCGMSCTRDVPTLPPEEVEVELPDV